MRNQFKTETVASVFSPSAIGVVWYLFFSGLVFSLHQLPAIQQYLRIPRDFNVARLLSSGLEDVLNSLIGSGRTAALVVGAFWAVVGLIVYLFLRGIAQFITELGEGMEQREFVWPNGTNRNRRLIEAGERVLFRVLAFAGLVFMVFVPGAHLLEGPIFVDWIGPDVFLRSVVWLLVSIFVLHICVVFTRLVLLRPRILD